MAMGHKEKPKTWDEEDVIDGLKGRRSARYTRRAAKKGLRRRDRRATKIALRDERNE